ncbi:hypothetical protein RHMOL_Rhmol01G0052900 [Rhododendron molle]|uniref:Uncharacterized protein n=1 Tax=Rhododendron molle TaxID=49168 RepID=A0ACC0Q190_RHOML|nr:hypothetical protein RHMOL_Rhmol01G0052900 [Rhododendron molle]
MDEKARRLFDDYSAQRLKELFEKFGELEDVVIMSSRKRVFPIIAMPSKDAASSKLVHVAGSEPSHLQMPSLSPSESSKNLFLSRQQTQETDQKAIGMEVLQNQLKLQHADLIFAAVKDPSNIHLLVICSNGLEKIYSCFSN